MLIVDDDRAIARFSPAFAEDRCFRISHFLVCKVVEGKRERFYLKLQINSIIERDVIYLPRNCYFVVSLPQIFAGYADDRGVFGTVFSLFLAGTFFFVLNLR